MNTKMKTVLGIVIFAIILGSAYFAYNKLSGKYNPDNTTTTTFSNLPESTTKVSKPAPDFTVLDVDGNPVKLSDFKGKPVVINFWASWCPPCKSEMPHFDEVYNEVKDEVVFLMIDLVDGSRETKETGKSYVALKGFTFPIYFDTDNDASGAYNVRSIPTTVFIDAQGNIVKKQTGVISETSLRNYIDKIK